MERDVRDDAEQARSCSAEDVGAFLHSTSEPVLAALLQNPELKDAQLRLLLERRDLSASVLERIAGRKEWLRDSGVRRSLVAHIHTPRRLAMKLARELEVMELAAISLRTTVQPEIRRFAEELLLTRVAHLPLGVKLTLARRGPGRVAGVLLAGGDERIARAALDNTHLTEAHLLRALSNDNLRVGIVSLIANHPKWHCFGTVRAALLRHPHAPMERVLSFLPDLPLSDLLQLSKTGELRADLRRALRLEVATRTGWANSPTA